MNPEEEEEEEEEDEEGNNPSTATSPYNTTIAELILDQAYILARDMAMNAKQRRTNANSTSSSNNNPDSDDTNGTYYFYPASELSYLSTKAFNHAVDLYYLASRKEDGRRWGRKAVELAGLITVQGQGQGQGHGEGDEDEEKEDEEDENKTEEGSSLADELEGKMRKWLL
jgi:hypothetical protein